MILKQKLIELFTKRSKDLKHINIKMHLFNDNIQMNLFNDSIHYKQIEKDYNTSFNSALIKGLNFI